MVLVIRLPLIGTMLLYLLAMEEMAMPEEECE